MKVDDRCRVELPSRTFFGTVKKVNVHTVLVELDPPTVRSFSDRFRPGDVKVPKHRVKIV